MVDLIIEHALLGAGDEQPLLGTGDAHIAQTAFLLHAFFIHQAAGRREDPLLQAGHEHIGEFQALGAMQDHQGDIAAARVFRLIQVGNEGHILQIVLQRRVFGGLAVLLHSAEEFLDILHPGTGLVGVFLLVLLHQTGALNQHRYEFAHRHGFLHGHQHGHEHEELADVLAGTGAQAVGDIAQRAVQGHAVVHGVLHQLLDGAVTDSALGHVDDAAQADVIRRIDDDAQVGHHVADFLAVIELLTAKDLIGDAGAHEHFFHHAGLGVGAVEHGGVAVGIALPVELADAVGDPGGFIPLVAGGKEADGFALSPLGPQGLFLAACVMGDDLIGSVQDVGGGAVILLQLDDGSVGIVLLKIEDVADIRAAPAVDGLIVVSHDAEVAALVGEELDHHILGVVGVLILVHHDIAEALAIALQHRRMIRQQLEGLDKQIVKVQGVVGLQAGFILQEDIVDHLAAIVLFGLPEPFIRAHELVLRIGDLGREFADGQELLVDIQPLEDFLQHGLLVIIVINHEGAGVTKLLDIAAEHTGTGGVEGGDPGIFRFIAHHFADALLHFLGSLVGEGQRENIPCGDAVVKQIRHAAGQRAGFAGTGAGKDQHRAFQRFSSQALLGIEHTQIHHIPQYSRPFSPYSFPCCPGRGNSRPRHKAVRG